jgi:lipopolysaccharide/colanic/teichoic acid biosynthesis glycosyltransferase
MLLIVGPIIFLSDRGPIFYLSKRIGVNGKVFNMYKFRSMKVDSPDIRNSDKSTYNGTNDPRVTRVGRIIRKLSIDEIPQLINVLKGDMSFVGPRPNMATTHYEDLDEIRKIRLKVRPGITGYSQAYFRNSISAIDKYKNDVFYVNNLSFFLDVKIFFKTIISVVFAKNINNDRR